MPKNDQTSAFNIQTFQFIVAKYDVDHDTINIHLNDKPEWLKEINLVAKVPILEVSSDSKTQFISESAKINEFLIKTFSSKDLNLRSSTSYSFNCGVFA